VQPGGSLYGLQHSNPVNPTLTYGSENPNNEASAFTFGSPKRSDGRQAGRRRERVWRRAGAGGLGVSGDTSCTDHMIAWRVRHSLGLDHLSGDLWQVIVRVGEHVSDLHRLALKQNSSDDALASRGERDSPKVLIVFSTLAKARR
jgi:hypothetical protein